MPTFNPHHEDETLLEEKQELKRPPLYRVLLHNDDFTTMEFVVLVLMEIFHKSEDAATSVMLAVHKKGVGVAGVYPAEIAETKVNQTINLARANDYPLLCTMEEDE